ncbi:MAG TPA: asparaginase domain-containing protein [Thermoanaerobaculia bacterium]|nr:asparaginase domain-containing protein [Thermoanaerobaculia bacterium]
MGRGGRRIALITTGGTIEKTYDEQSGELANRGSIVRRMLSELRLEETEVTVLELMSKDSLEMTEADRDRIVDAVRAANVENVENVESGGGGEGGADGIVVLHGTDTLALTGERLYERIAHPRLPIVLTGAMRPFEMKQSDALQNLTEALFATGVLAPGIYCAAHGRALAFPGVRKDVARGTFVKG